MLYATAINPRIVKKTPLIIKFVLVFSCCILLFLKIVALSLGEAFSIPILYLANYYYSMQAIKYYYFKLFRFFPQYWGQDKIECAEEQAVH